MKSSPTPAAESSKILNDFDTAGSRFQTRQRSLSHTCSVGFKSSSTSDVQFIFVFFDDARSVRSYNVISEHHFLFWPSSESKGGLTPDSRISSWYF